MYAIQIFYRFGWVKEFYYLIDELYRTYCNADL